MHLFRKDFLYRKRNSQIRIGMDEKLREIKQNEPDILAKIAQSLKRVVSRDEIHVTVYFIKNDNTYCNCLTAKLILLRKCSDKYFVYRQNYILVMLKEDTKYGMLKQEEEYIF